MVSVSASYLIKLYIMYKCTLRVKVRQRQQRCTRTDKKAAPNESILISELNIGQVAKSRETDERGKEISGNQDISVPLQLVSFGVILHIFQLLIRIGGKHELW